MGKVSFYTVQVVGNPRSEFADFMYRMKQNANLNLPIGFLIVMVRVILD